MLEHCGISLGRCSAETLMQAACRKTGLNDFGNDDFINALHVLIRSYNQDANLNLIGRIITCLVTKEKLVNRLLVRERLLKYPKILDESIQRPLFIVSLPRTGTTLLHRLLSLDSFNRPLLYKEVICPVLPHDPKGRLSDTREAMAQRALKSLYKMVPDLAAIHPVQVNEPEECFPLLANSFKYPSVSFGANVSGYLDWLKQTDFVSVYSYYKKQLQILQHGETCTRWVLKSPLHMLYMNELLHVFPDACIVQIHRDPAMVVPSFCSLISKLRGMASDHIDLNLIGQYGIDMLANMAHMSCNVRDSAAPDRFFDVSYEELVKDPIQTARRIYKKFGYNFTSGFEQSMHTWLHENPQHKHGVHEYSIEQFGLDYDSVTRRFATYCEHFNVLRGG